MINLGTLLNPQAIRKAIGWVLYAAFLDYCVHRVLRYFFGDLNPDPGVYYDAVFFTEENRDCMVHIVNKKSCGANCSFTKMRKLLGHMDRAKESLDVCIFLLTSHDFAFAIVDAHKRNVKVRVVTDGFTMQHTGSQIQFLIEQGVPVRVYNGGFAMHHKFFIADGKTLVNGSLNWTMQGLVSNSEDVVICCENAIINKLLGHFDLLWDSLG